MLRHIELRNRIYDYTTGDLVKYFPHMPSKYRQRPLFLGLAHACRQIRAEYSMIYAAQTVIEVRHSALQGFLDAGLPYMIRHKDGNVVGKLQIHCRKSPQRPSFQKYEHEVELLPLIKLCESMPTLKVRWILHGDERTKVARNGTTKSLDTIFEIARRPSLRTWINKTVLAVRYRYPTHLEFCMKSDQLKDWMNQWTIHPGVMARSRESRKEMQQWILATGLGLRRDDGLCFS